VVFWEPFDKKIETALAIFGANFVTPLGPAFYEGRKAD
jgi:hypothetical protein